MDDLERNLKFEKQEGLQLEKREYLHADIRGETLIIVEKNSVAFYKRGTDEAGYEKTKKEIFATDIHSACSYFNILCLCSGKKLILIDIDGSDTTDGVCSECIEFEDLVYATGKKLLNLRIKNSEYIFKNEKDFKLYERNENVAENIQNDESKLLLEVDFDSFKILVSKGDTQFTLMAEKELEIDEEYHVLRCREENADVLGVEHLFKSEDCVLFIDSDCYLNIFKVGGINIVLSEVKNTLGQVKNEIIRSMNVSGDLKGENIVEEGTDHEMFRENDYKIFENKMKLEGAEVKESIKKTDATISSTDIRESLKTADVVKSYDDANKKESLKETEKIISTTNVKESSKVTKSVVSIMDIRESLMETERMILSTDKLLAKRDTTNNKPLKDTKDKEESKFNYTSGSEFFTDKSAKPNKPSELTSTKKQAKDDLEILASKIESLKIEEDSKIKMYKFEDRKIFEEIDEMIYLKIKKLESLKEDIDKNALVENLMSNLDTIEFQLQNLNPDIEWIESTIKYIDSFLMKKINPMNPVHYTKPIVNLHTFKSNSYLVSGEPKLEDHRNKLFEIEDVMESRKEIKELKEVDLDHINLMDLRMPKTENYERKSEMIRYETKPVGKKEDLQKTKSFLMGGMEMCKLQPAVETKLDSSKQQNFWMASNDELLKPNALNFQQPNLFAGLNQGKPPQPSFQLGSILSSPNTSDLFSQISQKNIQTQTDTTINTNNNQLGPKSALSKFKSQMGGFLGK